MAWWSVVSISLLKPRKKLPGKKEDIKINIPGAQTTAYSVVWALFMSFSGNMMVVVAITYV